MILYQSTNPFKMFAYVARSVSAPICVPANPLPDQIQGPKMITEFNPKPTFFMPQSMPMPKDPFWKDVTPAKLMKKLGMTASVGPSYGLYPGFLPFDGINLSRITDAKTEFASGQNLISLNVADELQVNGGSVSEKDGKPMVFPLQDLTFVHWSKPLQIDRYLLAVMVMAKTPPTTEQAFLATVAQSVGAKLIEKDGKYEIHCPAAKLKDELIKGYEAFAQTIKPGYTYPVASGAKDFETEAMVLNEFSPSDIEKCFVEGKDVTLEDKNKVLIRRLLDQKAEFLKWGEKSHLFSGDSDIAREFPNFVDDQVSIVLKGSSMTILYGFYDRVDNVLFYF